MAPRRSRSALLLQAVLALAALAAFFLLTNTGFVQRVNLLIGQGRLFTLVAYVGVWGLCLAAALAAAFQPSLWVRGAWALVIAFTAAVGFAFHKASGSEFGVLDVVSLWNARHEASRAAQMYSRDLVWFALAAGGGFLALMLAPRLASPAFRRWAPRLALLPALPVLAIAGIVVIKEGGGSEALPTQFAPLAVALAAGGALAAEEVPPRETIAWEPTGAKVRNIVFIVDESVRADYLDFTPGNPFTPELAKLAPRLADFGPSASGGNCSHYSNAILRFSASRDAMGRAVLANPTLWQYAKKAGYRTVYIDGQAGFNRNPGKLQNFMTAQEAKDIDDFRPLPEDVSPPALDDRVLDLIESELKQGGPVLIYANKNGAHFPYDNSYPADAAPFHPIMSETAGDTQAARIGSYRNAVAWTVDRFFARLFAEVDLTDTVVVYTSDHGQQFDPGRLSHCTVEDPDPREGLVPLLAVAGDAAMQARLLAAAQASRGFGSHFAIAPTLYELMGYRPVDIATRYPGSLFSPDRRPPGFSTGDIFGLFSNKVRWHELDTARDYREPAGAAAPAPTAAVTN